ncbi:hypothetical protein llap_18401 [Limosa lapponica baueri]|uniref:Ig-like domain-containing protein n=1 Tax=Limosa lapponica baueri TaxID=1758121 RepID=A0A2I0TBY7_LIMLA|nr:hypothetical protein llap_18401 [Limosa lapponica baueri]
MDVLSVRGASVIMNCSAYCETSPKIEWKKDGTFLNLVSDDRRQLLPDGSLLINSVVHSKHNKPDEGYYQCVATVESLGTIVSRTAKLTVAGEVEVLEGAAGYGHGYFLSLDICRQFLDKFIMTVLCALIFFE